MTSLIPADHPIFHDATAPHPWRLAAGVAPGVALCVGVSAIASALERAERAAFGRAWLETLVLAIVLGAATRAVWSPAPRWRAGLHFSAKILLEVAVVLLGASVSAATLLSVGPILLAAIAGVVAVAILASYGVGRLLGLPWRMAILIACGNSICGNSAIAAVAPIVDADGDDVAASIGFTAVLGVLVVLGLPVLGGALRLSPRQFGALAGLTVYAVPQVLAAASPFGPAALQIGALVKLTRVLMLGPVCVVLSLLSAKQEGGPRRAHDHLAIHRLAPWFIVGFLAMIGLRSLNLIPHALLPAAASGSSLLTVVSMAALGLETDVRLIAKAGGRATLTVVASLAMLGAVSLGIVMTLHPA